MPSPFPGMDPWLEHPEVFPDLHDAACSHLRDMLTPALPRVYYAGLGSRIWVESPARHPVPDVAVMRRPVPSKSGGATAVAEADVETGGAVVVRVPYEEFHENFVEIFVNREGTRRLVTVVEILSSTNKTVGERARDKYVEKREELHEGGVNTVEIDLLRSGRHSTGVPLETAIEQTGPFDYHVCIHRADKPWRYFVHPIRLRDRLPEIRIPLLPEDGSVPLDLQAVLNRCYDLGGYDRRVEYHTEPVPPLTAEQAEWAKELLRRRTA